MQTDHTKQRASLCIYAWGASVLGEVMKGANALHIARMFLVRSRGVKIIVCLDTRISFLRYYIRPWPTTPHITLKKAGLVQLGYIAAN